MRDLPRNLQNALESVLDAQILSATSVGGGMINRTARLDTTQGSLFLKWKPDAPPGFFAVEADGLRRLKAAGALRVPEVLAFGETQADCPAYLALEYIETRPPTQPVRFVQNFGEALAALHREVVSPTGQFGLETDNFIGVLPQRNAFQTDWRTFYRECRLLPQIAMARERQLLPAEREHRLMQIVERLDTLLDGLEARPVLLHGDLWSGNFLSAGNEPVLVDPAVYYGEREIEIAFIELFGGFPSGLLDAYRAATPLDPGYARRRPLHQLVPLLVHLNHFGETYGPDVDAVCRLYLG